MAKRIDDMHFDVIDRSFTGKAIPLVRIRKSNQGAVKALRPDSLDAQRMRILTWNVNALRTVLPFHPWTELSNKTIGGMLEAMNAEIICFQEHKARRDNMEKPTAVPPNFDAFFSFPHGKGGYSGTCTYVKSSHSVPLKAEEGITGRLLGTVGGNSALPKLVYKEEERIGGYVADGKGEVLDNHDGSTFDLNKLDMEGRAVVLDFGFFVIFNLYCPNETNETRLPYKLNFLTHLSTRISNLIAQGRNVIVLGDINVCHTPLDNGEGGIQRNAQEHYTHPARQWFDAWLADGKEGRGVMWDVTRRCWPDRKGMFTCWNQKLDARPSNYGSRIDYILVTEGLLPWIKHSDIQPQIYGSDHCPVYVDLHDSLTRPDGTTLILRDLMNSPDRLPLPPQLETLRDEERKDPEPPAFATKWWDEFSGKQRSLMSFFGKKGTVEPAGKGPGKVGKEPRKRERSGSVLKDDTVGSRLSPRPIEGNEKASEGLLPSPMMVDEDSLHVASAPTIDLTDTPIEVSSSPIEPTFTTPTRKPIKIRPLEPSNNNKTQIKSSKKQEVGKGKVKEKEVTSQTTLVSFFRQPTVSPIASTSARKKGKRIEISPETKRRTHIRSESLSSALNSCPIEIDEDEESDEAASTTVPKRKRRKIEGTDDRDQTEEDEVTAAALAQQEEPIAPAEQDQAGVVKTWGNIFAKKVPPKCIVHRVPCKSFVSKVTGTKGKKFWLCAKPVGEGWDTGRAKRPRNEVNTEFRCDFFIWDSAVKEKETVDGKEEEVGVS